MSDGGAANSVVERGRRALKAPMNDSEFWNALVDALPCGVALISEAREILYWSDGAAIITGLPSDDMVGRRCEERLCGLTDCFCFGRHHTLSSRPERTAFRRPDGRPVTIEVRCSRFTSPGGEQIGVHLFTDITEKAFDEDAVQEVNELLMSAAERMMNQANTDGLTGLLNHRALKERLEQEISRMRRNGRPVAVIIFDVDHFKKFNDTYGHPFGDKVLCAIARTARNVCRHEDVVARYGGEEFLVILPETRLEGAKATAERLRAAVEALVVEDSGAKARVTVSCGVAIVTPADPEAGDRQTAIELIQRADAALYRAKNRGRNRVEAQETPEGA